MQKFRALVSAFGFDKNAMDMADILSGAWSIEKVQKVLAALQMKHLIYHGPGPLIAGLTPIAQHAFSPRKKMPLKPTIPTRAPVVE